MVQKGVTSVKLAMELERAGALLISGIALIVSIFEKMPFTRLVISGIPIIVIALSRRSTSCSSALIVAKTSPRVRSRSSCSSAVFSKS